jgi:hypothetical protein
MGDYMGTFYFNVQVAVNRAETLMRARLLIRPSELRRLNPHTQEYDMPIGNGLFCKERIRSGQQIVHFSGEPLRTRAEVQQARVVSQHGGYVITNHTETMAWIVFRLPLGISVLLVWLTVHISARTYIVAPSPKLTCRRLARR